MRVTTGPPLQAVRLPEVSEDGDIDTSPVVDEIFEHDARDMHQVADNSVALVVTSPPYFAGKEYEAALGEGHVPATYAAYLAMIESVFPSALASSSPAAGSRSTWRISAVSRTGRCRPTWSRSSRTGSGCF